MEKVLRHGLSDSPGDTRPLDKPSELGSRSAVPGRAAHLKMPQCGEGVEKREPSCTVGGNVN